jgi:hypothetical protein
MILIHHEIMQASYLGRRSSEFSRLERVGSSVVLLSVVEVVEVLVVVLLSVNALFLLWRDDPPFPLTVNVDSTTISSNASPNAAEKTRQIHNHVETQLHSKRGINPYPANVENSVNS